MSELGMNIPLNNITFPEFHKSSEKSELSEKSEKSELSEKSKLSEKSELSELSEKSKLSEKSHKKNNNYELQRNNKSSASCIHQASTDVDAQPCDTVRPLLRPYRIRRGN